VSLFWQKLQVAGGDRYLIVPINWALQRVYVDDHQRLYGIVVTSTLNALRAAEMRLIPIMNALHHWFLTLIAVPGWPALPQFRDFPADAVTEIGKSIHKAWNDRAGLEAFVAEVARFPGKIARAFCFKGAVPVFDHFDACALQVEPGSRFTESPGGASLARALSRACGAGPFFVASQDDGAFSAAFQVRERAELSTERIVEDGDERTLAVAAVRMSVAVGACRGCPAYRALFDRVCGLAAESAERAAAAGQFARLRSVVDVSRNETLRQEFVRMAVLLAGADADGVFEEDAMNELLSLPEFTVRVRG